MNGWPLLPLQHSKNLGDAASKASREQYLRKTSKIYVLLLQKEKNLKNSVIKYFFYFIFPGSKNK
jgi:hypothetical protein